MPRTAHAPAAPSRAEGLPRWRLRPAAGHTKRDFLSLDDLTPAEFQGLLDLAAEVKAHPALFKNSLEGRAAALIFEKPSLRTRVTFEVGVQQLGGQPVYLAPADVSLGKREALADVARNLARWVDVLIVRTFAHSILEEMAAEAHIPVINALSDLLHPCQAVADLLTLREHKGELKSLRLAYVGDGNNVAHALAQAAAKAGMHLTIATPRGYEPVAVIFRHVREDAIATGARIQIVQDPDDAVYQADAVYTDVWTSMGQETEVEERRKVFGPYQVNHYRMSLAKPDALFLHCLPAHRGEEVTDEVLDGVHSVVLDQAENRLHVAKAVLLALLEGPR
jgi:ornithine carbamoyltransferase